MSAVDNKHLIEVLATKVESGVSKRTGNAYEIKKIQCVIRGPDGSIQVGVLRQPRSFDDVQPGKYLAEFELGLDYDNNIMPVLTKLHVYSETPKPAPKAA